MRALSWKTARKVPLGGEGDFSTHSTIMDLCHFAWRHDDNRIRLSGMEKGQVGPNKRACGGLIIPLRGTLPARKMKNGIEC